MVSVSDILKILDQVPIWKRLKAMPERIEALEARVAELESAIADPREQPGEPCPACGAPALRRTSSVRSSGPFGPLGAKDEVWTCSACGEKDERFNVK